MEKQKTQLIMKEVELLAPAKDKETGISAIKCGADAVYIGASKFGARSNAGNSLQDIEELISFAHKYRAKTYITVNTILNNDEIPEAEKLINRLYEIGADAVIIQDMGLLELDLPPIPIFASTQTHNNTWQKVEFLEKVGFKRVILARELSLEQIKEIRGKTSIELESFIHGALCVSYSGQCYLSYALGGRSGNRGECAQPCRKLYSLMDSEGNFIAKNRYLLSLKDLNFSEYIKELLDAGITSFKIEGRLKDISYIKNIVSLYRQKIDAVIEGKDFRRSSSGKSIITFNPDPYKTFNRGYTDYFLNGRNKDIVSFNTPKSIGEPVGKVVSVNKDYFTLKSSVKLNNGDGICFFDSNNILCGTNINRVQKNHIYPNDIDSIKANTFIYRNLDREFLKQLDSEIERKISLDILFYEENNSLFLQAVDEDGVEASIKLNIEKEIANNAKMALDNIEKQFKKLGDTEFICNKVKINLKTPYFIPVKILNEFRRNLIEELRKNRSNTYKRETSLIRKNDFPYFDEFLCYHANILNDYAVKFYSRHGVKDIEPAVEAGAEMKQKRVMITKHCLKYQFNLCPKQAINKPPQELLYLIDSQGRKYRLNFDCDSCKMEIFF